MVASEGKMNFQEDGCRSMVLNSHSALSSSHQIGSGLARKVIYRVVEMIN